MFCPHTLNSHNPAMSGPPPPLLGEGKFIFSGPVPWTSQVDSGLTPTPGPLQACRPGPSSAGPSRGPSLPSCSESDPPGQQGGRRASQADPHTLQSACQVPRPVPWADEQADEVSALPELPSSWEADQNQVTQTHGKPQLNRRYQHAREIRTASWRR